MIFHPPQKKSTHTVKLLINSKQINQEKSIKYLGIYIDQHLSWKSHILYLAKKIKRGIGVLSKIRHFVNIKILTQLYILPLSILNLWPIRVGQYISVFFKLNSNLTEKDSENYDLVQFL